MRVRCFEIEASPAELDASSTLSDLLARLAGQPASQTSNSHTVPVENVEADDAVAEQVAAEAAETPTPSTADAVPGVAAEGQEVVRALLEQNSFGDLFEQFLAETTTWPSVAVIGIQRKGHVAGTPLDYSDYLRLRKTGSQFGGFAYVYAGTGFCNFRLKMASDDELDAVAPDAWRTPKGHHEYSVGISIVDESTLRQAIELARQAYDLT